MILVTMVIIMWCNPLWLTFTDQPWFHLVRWTLDTSHSTYIHITTVCSHLSLCSFSDRKVSSLSSPPYTATWWLLSTLHSLNWLQDTKKLSRSLFSKLEERFKFHTMHAQHEFTIVSFFTLDFDGKFILSSAHGLTLNCTSTEIQNNELLINWMSLFLFYHYCQLLQYPQALAPFPCLLWTDLNALCESKF